jgi:hypothetical protein
MGNLLEFDTTLNSSSLMRCNAPTLLCNLNSRVAAEKIFLYRDAQIPGSEIAINGTTSTFEFGWKINAPVLAGTNINVGNGINVGSVGLPSTQQLFVNGIENFITPGCGFGFGLGVKFDGILDGREGAIRYNLGFAGPDFDQMCFQLDTSGNYPLVLQNRTNISGGPYTGIFNGDFQTTTLEAGSSIITPSASVLVSTTPNDLAYFDTATGHLADSNVLKGALVLLNAANQFGNFTQTFGLSGSGAVQISNTGIAGINPALATTYSINNSTGNATFNNLTVASCTGCGGGGGILRTTTSVTSPAAGTCTLIPTVTFASALPAGATIAVAQQSGGVAGWGGSFAARITGSTTVEIEVCSIAPGGGGFMPLNVTAQ